MFESVDLSPSEERVYLALLERAPLGSAVADAVGPAVEPQAARALERLVEKGLAISVPSDPPEFMPVPPEVGIGALVRRSQERLELARLAARKLGDRVGRRHGLQTAPVTVVTGRAEVTATYVRLQDAAEKEILGLDTPFAAGEGPGTDHGELDALRRGVRYRVIYDANTLDRPGRLDAAEALIAAGQDARVLPSLPVRLVVADHRIGLLWGEGGDRAPTAILVRPSAVLDALSWLFEDLWAKSVSVLPGEGIAADTLEGDELSEADRAVLSLLALGQKDEAISRKLGMGLRTVQRRIADLMETLGARTRFQAAAIAAKRGWI